MGIFCYTVYSECIVLCLWKLCFKLYFHMFCWGQSTLSLKATEVCFRTEGNLIKIAVKKSMPNPPKNREEIHVFFLFQLNSKGWCVSRPMLYKKKKCWTSLALHGGKTTGFSEITETLPPPARQQWKQKRLVREEKREWPSWTNVPSKSHVCVPGTRAFMHLHACRRWGPGSRHLLLRQGNRGTAFPLLVAPSTLQW